MQLHSLLQTSERLHQKVCSFLSNPTTYGHGQKPVKVIKTHSAVIFLGPDLAYKIKQPVKYAYLDFSTLAKRKAACLRELKINQPLAPSIYMGVIAITQENDGSVAINGKGNPVEWAVKMHRFAEKNLLNRIAERGELDNDLARRLGNQIAEFHNSLDAQKYSDGALRIFEVLQQLDNGLKALGQIIAAADRKKFNNKCEKIFSELKPVLDKRGRSGMIRRGHADLHLGNIVLINAIPTLFDALEFDERLATTDVVYDIAFLIMDMLHQGLNRQANTAFNRYLLNAWPLVSRTGLVVLPLFLGMRGAIRAMVTAQAAERDAAAFAKLADESRTYFSQALNYLERPAPVLLAVAGLSGSGKTTLAIELAAYIGCQPGAMLLRSDVERKLLAGVEEHSKLPPEAYTVSSSRQVFNRLMEKADDILAQGYSVILDTVFDDPQERQAACDLASTHNVAFCGLFLFAPREVLLARVSSRKPDASDANAEIVRQQLKNFGETFAIDRQGWVKIDASKSSAATLKAVEKTLNKRAIALNRSAAGS